MASSIKCPHCTVSVFIDFYLNPLQRYQSAPYQLTAKTGNCPSCGRDVVFLMDLIGGKLVNQRLVHPRFVLRGIDTSQVPKPIVDDYEQAVAVIEISTKASAALSRRCLQNMLNDKGYPGKDLSKQIINVLAETDPGKALSESLRTTIDGVRNFGNFSAHPLTDQSTLQIVDVDPQEAEWCLDILEECFDHFYTKPAAAKARKATLDAKLKALGKPPSH